MSEDIGLKRLLLTQHRTKSDFAKNETCKEACLDKNPLIEILKKCGSIKYGYGYYYDPESEEKNSKNPPADTSG